MEQPVVTPSAREEFARLARRLLAEGGGAGDRFHEGAAGLPAQAAAARSGDGQAVRLAEVAAWIEAEAREVEVAGTLGALDALASRARDVTGMRGTASDSVRRLVAFLSQHGFHSRDVDFEAAEGSLLGHVLATRRGLPLTLSVIYLDLARQLGLPMEGVSTPGRFLLRSRAEEDLVIDPFEARIVTDEECTRLFRSILGRGDVAFARDRLRAATVREMATRILVNLRVGYANRAELGRAVGCTDRILLLWPEDVGELFRRGMLYEKMGYFPSAMRDFEAITKISSNAEATSAAQARLEKLRRSAHTIH